MDSDLNCPLCQQQFQDQNPPRLLTNCGHTFCQKCLKKIITEKKGSYKLVCPEDGEMVTLKDNSMTNFPKNIALLKIIESKKNPIENLQVSKIVKTQEIQQDDDTSDIVASIISPNNTTSEDNIKAEMKDDKQQSKQKPKQSRPAKPDVQMCLLHQKPLQVVCVIDLKKICASCAIFGQHRGHDFKSIDEIQKQRQAYYNAILNIMEKKDSLSQRISSEQTCQAIMQILEKKKQNMKKSIGEKYSKLISAIQAKQKQSMKSLQGVIVKTESKLRNLMKIDASTLQKYDKWQEKSYKQIKILEGQDFQSKLHLLFVGASNQVDVLEEGDNIIDLMYKQQENLINQVQLALENIGVDFNMDIFNYIDNFVQIFDQSKKKKTKGRSANKSDGLTSVNSNAPARPSIANSIPVNQKKQDDNIKQLTQAQSKQNIKHNSKQQRTFQGSSQGHHQESLLQMLEQLEVKKIQQPQKQKLPQPPPKQEQDVIPTSLKQTPEKNTQFDLSLNQSDGKGQKMSSKKMELENKKSPQLTERSNPKDSSFVQQKIERPNKKKLAKIKVGQKYQKMLQGLANDKLETVDFTNAELGDATMIQVCEFLRGSKARTVKLISNKLSDDAITKIVPYMDGVITLNLSQNFLTQRVLDILYDAKEHLHSIKSIILSQNKIVQRKAKAKIDKLRSLQITVSV